MSQFDFEKKKKKKKKEEKVLLTLTSSFSSQTYMLKYNNFFVHILRSSCTWNTKQRQHVVVFSLDRVVLSLVTKISDIIQVILYLLL